MRLLLAEDEKSLSKAVVYLLEHNNYQVDAAYDGEEALEALETGNYDGAILDIMMPKKDGLEVLGEIRRRGSRIPVMMLTAKSEVDDKVLGLDSGANDYMAKPFAVQEFLARVRSMIRVQTEQLSPQLCMNNIVLDRKEMELSSLTGSFRLSNKEFQMMEFFLCNPAHRISAERLKELIWRDENDAELNIVWIYISYLRKKLTALHAEIQLEGTQESGYVLEEIK